MSHKIRYKGKLEYIITKVCHQWVMSSEPLVVQVLITELPTWVEKKSKQTDLNYTPVPMLYFCGSSKCERNQILSKIAPL